MAHQGPNHSIRIQRSFGTLDLFLWDRRCLETTRLVANLREPGYDDLLTRCDSYAIKGSPNQKLLLEDIYYAIESRVCWNMTFRRMTDLRNNSFKLVPLFSDCTQRLESE
jgi:hypothetical protein